MKIVFISNYFNHHQKPLSEVLYQLTDGNYRFIATSEMPQERKNLGYQLDLPDYVIQAHKNQNDRQQAETWLLEADLVIAGAESEDYLTRRKKENKLIFRYAERPLKKGFNPLLFLPRWIKWHLRNLPGKPIYMLAASAYTAADYGKFGLFRGKTYCWGYFPEARIYPEEKKLIDRKDPQKLLWCGRFLDWKHPDDAIMLAKHLKEGGYAFSLDMIGTGEMEQQLKAMVLEFELEDCVHFLGSMPPEQVRSHMEQAGIYLLTSDRKEGWGAVVNEAMNSGCAVIGSHAAGSVPFLIEDGKNGYVIKSGDSGMLYEKTAALLTDIEKQRNIGYNAYNTIVSLWNAEIAAARLVALAESICRGIKEPDLFHTGPCSKAIVLKDHWM